MGKDKSAATKQEKRTSKKEDDMDDPFGSDDADDGEARAGRSVLWKEISGKLREKLEAIMGIKNNKFSKL